MRSDRRRELQSNELATWVGHQVEKHREHLPAVLWGAIAVAAAIVLFTLWNSRQSTTQVGAWDEYHHVGNIDVKARPKRLKEIAERYPSSPVALWARLDLADQLCYDGSSKLDIDREIAISHLREAQQTYAQVLQNPKALPEMIRRAAVAEGKCWELMGNREKAIESYRSVAKQFDASHPALAQDAARRADELEQPEAADFYKWLAEYKPPETKPLNVPGLGTFPEPLSPPTAPTQPDSDSLPKPAADSEKHSDADSSSGNKEGATTEPPADPGDAKSSDKPGNETPAPTNESQPKAADSADSPG